MLYIDYRNAFKEYCCKKFYINFVFEDYLNNFKILAHKMPRRQHKVDEKTTSLRPTNFLLPTFALLFFAISHHPKAKMIYDKNVRAGFISRMI